MSMVVTTRGILLGVKNVPETTKLLEDTLSVKDLGKKCAAFRISDSSVDFVDWLDPQNGGLSKFLQAQGEGLYEIISIAAPGPDVFEISSSAFTSFKAPLRI